VSEHINTEEIYDTLKDFQKVTVDFAYERLQKNGRFLVADEVGLGKTMIAKGVIAKTYDELKNKNKKIEIVYITTNQSIASQNIETLKIGNAKTETTRLSLLVTKLDNSDSSPISFKSFTVGTSLEFKGNSTGLKEEREFLIFLLKKTDLIKGLWGTTLEDFFRQTASEIKIDKSFDIPTDFCNMYKVLIEENLPNIRELISSKENSSQTIKELRKLLILANLKYLSPDLIILDEFQRFSKLLIDEGIEDNEIIKTLFNFEDSKTLLLSATPYKLLDCKNSEHYDEFYGLISWLYQNKFANVEQLKIMFNSINKNNKTEIEDTLKKVMCRTERTSFSSDGMIERKEIKSIGLKSSFLKEYEKYHNLGIVGLTRYLKSSPSPLNFMKDSYLVKTRFDALSEDKSLFIVNQKHPKLEMLKQEVKNQSLENYIWMPPLNPYVKTRGVTTNSSTKILIFSQWDFTPDSIVGSFSHKEKKRYKNYTDIKSFVHRDKLLQVTTQDKDLYSYDGVLSFTQLVKESQKKYEVSALEAKVLLGSPANVIYRSILKYGNIKKSIIKEWVEYSETQWHIAEFFLHFLGRQENYKKLKIKNSKNKLEEILDYCIKHNMQSMFDEYIHLLTDSPRYGNISDDNEKMNYLYKMFETVFKLSVDRIKINTYIPNEKDKILTSKFAMRISKSSMRVKSENENQLDDENYIKSSADTAKISFNSPFAPFLLATTSIGQEGLDFHPYCHQIWHWDLPSNPVDLEQREGRIHRYKNYAVRKNISKVYEDRCWMEKFKKAKQYKKCDFETFWLFSTDDANQKIERVVPLLPLSKDEEKYNNLLKQVGLYRQAIGQKRQSDVFNEDVKLVQISLKPC